MLELAHAASAGQSGEEDRSERQPSGFDSVAWAGLSRLSAGGKGERAGPLLGSGQLRLRKGRTNEFVSTISEWFAAISDWKNLPAYRAEPRVDSIIGLTLGNILAHARAISVLHVIPELPIRIGSLDRVDTASRDSNRSYKVDFLVVTESGECILVEFKTDMDSLRDGQDEYLGDAQRVGMTAILNGIEELRSHTVPKHRAKYDYLVTKLAKAGLLTSTGGVWNPAVRCDTPRVLYIQPRRLHNGPYKDVVDFVAVAAALESAFPNDDFIAAFVASIRSWA